MLMDMTIAGFLQDDPKTGTNWWGKLRANQAFSGQDGQKRSSFLSLKAFSGTAELLTEKGLVKGDFIVAKVEFRNGEAKQDGSGYYPDYFQILKVVYAGPYNGGTDAAGGQQGGQQAQRQTHGAQQQRRDPVPAGRQAPPAFNPDANSPF